MITNRMLLFFVSLALLSCNSETNSLTEKPVEKDSIVVVLPPLVKAPVAEFDIPFEEFILDAEVGGVYTVRSGGGSRIILPPSVMVDSYGDLLQGDIKFRYREFHDAADIYCAGIPMDYDAAGMIKRFETAGMFELRAYDIRGNEVFVDSGKTMSVSFAGTITGSEYHFFYLDEKGTRNWHYIGDEGGVFNPEKEKIRRRKQASALKIPLGPDYFSFNYMAALDVMLNDNVQQINKNRSSADFRTKISEYGLGWSNIYNYQSVQFEGRTMLASLLVWKNIGGKKLPDWAGKSDSKLVPLEGNVYELQLIEKGGTRQFSTRIEPFMSLKALFAFSAAEWKSNYEKTLQRVKEDEKRLTMLADVYREMEINRFGIYNYDRFLNDKNAVVVKADFRFDRDAGILQNQEVCYVSGTDRALIKYPFEKWSQFILLPDPGAQLFALLPGNFIAVFSPKEYNKVDQKKLKLETEPAVVFELHTVRQFNGAEDLRMILDGK
ncbi:MAG TPA: hypothetical protein DEP18_06835 [Flavobacteriales bacterium]|nr:hypothetical protein [Flavobacteriales bacterium]HRE73808.1 hypothetical protein [Flavobacteriales bacterium]HRJ39178.1 hypothetical protein [Flavobacteriales bacterium]